MSTNSQAHIEPQKGADVVQPSAGHEEARVALQTEALNHLSSPKAFSPAPKPASKSEGALAAFVHQADDAEASFLDRNGSAFKQEAVAQAENAKPKANTLANHTALQSDGGKSYLALNTANLYSPQAKARADQLVLKA